MPQIIPIKELKDTAKVSDMCHRLSEPIYITKNGYGDMVIMSMETYEENNRREQIYRDLEISESQFSEKRGREANQSLAEMRAKYGI